MSPGFSSCISCAQGGEQMVAIADVLIAIVP
jgi:hypothetical protein